MTVLHKAYVFDAEGYARALRERCGAPEAGGPDLDALHGWARSLVAAGSAWKRRVLEGLRFEDAWMSPPGSPDADPRLWVLVTIVGALEAEVPSLTHRLHSSYAVLRQALPHFGWTQRAARKLVFGQSLAQLPAFRGEVAAPWRAILGRREDCGWLPQRSATRILGRLEGLNASLRNPPAEVRAVLRAYADQQSSSVEAVLQAAFEDAIDMLGAAGDRDHDLFLLMIQ